MISAILAGTARHPRRVLGGGVAVAGGLLGVHLLAAPYSGTRFAVAALLPLLGLVFMVLTLVAQARWRPAAFVVDAGVPAFRTLRQPGHVYNASGVAFMSAAAVTAAVNARGVPRDPASSDLIGLAMARTLGILALLIVVMAVLLAAAVAWRGIGVQLRPEGVMDRSLLGTVTVPWDALTTNSLPPTTPSARLLRLTYARPDLVRVTGLPLTRQINTDTVNALFLAHTLHHYLIHPQHRPHIGTAAGYAELLTALHGPGPRRPADTSRSGPGHPVHHEPA
ncbi:hypothetical protein [Dactylosporangium sp. NPDC005555]|uniref:hypothetical protein n=1 Tax=Dactylosporangium sp. NPDC005555 TaxID=3154889 RepID=UPI0033B13D6F